MGLSKKWLRLAVIWINACIIVYEARSSRSLKELASDETRGCGVAKERDSRVVGGSIAADNEFPWMAYLVFKFVNVEDEDDDVYFSCGGSLIHPSWILTAAHCIQTESKEKGIESRMTKYLISLADYNVMTETGDENIIVQSSLDNLHPHPDYEKRTIGDYDIGLIRLENPVELSSRISLVCLPTHGESLDVVDLSIVNSGWGKKENNEESTYLRKAMVKGISNEICGKYFEEDHEITDTMICTQSDTSNHCMGDSGSPVISQTTTGNYIQLGIVGMSFVDEDGMCIIGLPSIHTSVSRMMDWIEEVTQISKFP